MDSFQLRSVTVEVGARGDYLHVVLTGDLPTVDDAKQVTSLLQHLIDKRATHRLLVSAHDFVQAPSKEVWGAVWKWLHGRTCRQFAWVAPSGTADLTVTTLNLAAIADSVGFRAFGTTLEAVNWLERRTTVDRRGMADFADEPSPGRPVSSGRYSAVTESGRVPTERARTDTRDAPIDSRPSSSARRRPSVAGLIAVRESDEPPRTRRADPRAEPSEEKSPDDDLPARPRGARG